EGGMQGRRNRRHHEGNGCRALALGFQHGLRHLLHEQRNTIGPLDDVLSDIRWERLITDDPVDDRLHFASRQPVDCEGSDVRLSEPRRLEVRSKSYEQQYAKTGYLVDDATKQFEASGVGPMCIFKNNQQWT